MNKATTAAVKSILYEIASCMYTLADMLVEATKAKQVDVEDVIDGLKTTQANFTSYVSLLEDCQ